MFKRGYGIFEASDGWRFFSFACESDVVNPIIDILEAKIIVVLPLRCCFPKI